MNKSDYIFQLSGYRGFKANELKKLTVKELKYLMYTTDRPKAFSEKSKRRRSMSAEDIRKKFIRKNPSKKYMRTLHKINRAKSEPNGPKGFLFDGKFDNKSNAVRYSKNKKDKLGCKYRIIKGKDRRTNKKVYRVYIKM